MLPNPLPMDEPASKDEIDAIGQVLIDRERPLKERFRSLFTLKNLGGEYAIDYMVQAFDDPSALLKHEVAYCLGQMRDKYAIPFLVNILKDTTQEPMVRHEAGEALGAIGDLKTVEVLKEYSHDSTPEVAETCQLAVRRLEWLEKDNLPPNENNIYLSVDPAPPHTCTDVEELRKILIDESLPLFERYRAMFALRNIGTVDAITALSEGLSCPLSALFRHEVAFVFGQMQRSECAGALMESLKKMDESEMVRHECAEALGSIGTEECNEILRKYLSDEARVVRESCEIALDISEYESDAGGFQYADVLEKLRGGEK